MTIREALLAMGYREIKPGYWLKPIGYQLFFYHEEKNQWVNSFNSMKGEVEYWEHKEFKKDGNYLHQLKEFECWTRTDMFVNGQSQFELFAIDV